MADRLLDDFTDALRCLPGVGPKSAQRMAFHLLQRNREGGLRLAELMQRSMHLISYCKSCRNFTEAELCRLCTDPGRDGGKLCIVESPSDQAAIERATEFRGQYFVLHGRLSPLDGIGPEELGIDELERKFQDAAISEVILATNSTVEGEATAQFLTEMVRKHGLKVMRIAHGVPLGGELEYVDGGTLSHAFAGRTPV